MRRIATFACLFALLLAFSTTTFAEENTGQQTDQQKLQTWLHAPAQQQWHSKALIGETWWHLMYRLPLDQAQQMWPAAVKTHSAQRITDVARILAIKKENYKQAKTYYQDKIKTPKGADEEQVKMWQSAQKKSYQRTRILIHFAKEGNLDQQLINKEALAITGGTIQRAAYGIALLDYVTGQAKATLLLNAIDKYGDSPNQMAGETGLLHRLKKALAQKTITHDQALQAIKKAAEQTQKKLADMDTADKDYKQLKQYSTKLTALSQQMTA